MSNSLNKGLERIEVALSWDPNPAGTPAHDLDLMAAVYTVDDPQAAPAYLVHFDSRSPEGTIELSRDSRDGRGFGVDERMTVEFDRVSTRYHRVVIGVAVQQQYGRLTFAQVAAPEVRIREHRREVLTVDLTGFGPATAARVADFVRNASGAWVLRAEDRRGFDTDPATFAQIMGS
ncbi:TerD family protein [Kitasatospora sp. NPDC058965]|uniref:TerD family protein n=1 Tax=Kitasatospora sp. NPDC058965 TaxID=3346682 RepID=UPI0036C54CEC